MVTVLIGLLSLACVLLALFAGAQVARRREERRWNHVTYYIMWFHGNGARFLILNTISYEHIVAIAQLYDGMAIVMEVQQEDFR